MKEILEDTGEIDRHPMNSSVFNLDGRRFESNILVYEDGFCHLTAFEHAEV